MTKFSVTHFTREEFEKYKEKHENEKTKVYEVIIGFDLHDDDAEDVGFFSLLTVALRGDNAIDEIIKKCKNEEIVTYEIIGKKEDTLFKCDGIELQYKTLYFKYLIKGVFTEFEFNKTHESYTINFSGELLSATVEYTKEKEK